MSDMKEFQRLSAENRKLRKLRKDLRILTAHVAHAIALIDVEMAQPSDNERGKRIAKITNALEMSNDQARHFGLGQPLRRKTTAAVVKGGR